MTLKLSHHGVGVKAGRRNAEQPADALCSQVQRDDEDHLLHRAATEAEEWERLLRREGHFDPSEWLAASVGKTNRAPPVSGFVHDLNSTPATTSSSATYGRSSGFW